MKTRTPFRILALTALAALGITATLWPWTTPAERAAAPIVEKNAAARGGLERWRAVRSLALTGRLEAGVPRDPVKLAKAFQRSLTQMKAEARIAAARGGHAREKQVELPFVMELKRPRMSRVEIRFQGQTAVQTFDGTQGWKLRPFLGHRSAEPFTAEELRLASQQADLDGPLLDAAAKHERVSLLGTEKVDGRDAYKLEVKDRGGQVRHVWVDAQTFLDVKVDGMRHLDGKMRPVFTAYRDFRPVDGVLIPHALETSVEGVPGSEKIVVEHAAVNVQLGDALFGRPD
jgi:hypothetical protein